MTASAEKDSIYRQEIDICGVTLKAGHTYLAIGFLCLNVANPEILTSVSIRNKSGTIDAWWGGMSAKAYGENGGGVYCLGVIACKTDCVVMLVGYGYHNSSYKHLGNLLALQLR